MQEYSQNELRYPEGKKAQNKHLPNSLWISLTHTFSQPTPRCTPSFMFLKHTFFFFFLPRASMALLYACYSALPGMLFHLLLKLGHKLSFDMQLKGHFLHLSLFCMTVLLFCPRAQNNLLHLLICISSTVDSSVVPHQTILGSYPLYFTSRYSVYLREGIV